ncbi:hypothetical protein V5O48_003738 [Marasmius crinis-equi]|uniref:Uncharacterized protein n=1 Tax=Marasmius crinis-equi TaxID=585013 RepID=A0ABR3FRZ5_9AGAR
MNPASPAQSQSSRKAVTNNVQIFQRMRRELQSGDQYPLQVNRLARFLNNEKAYYDEGRGEVSIVAFSVKYATERGAQITNLLEIARDRLRDVLGLKETSFFDATQHPKHPWVPQYICLIQVVRKFIHRFHREPHLKTRIIQIVSTVPEVQEPQPQPERAQQEVIDVDAEEPNRTPSVSGPSPQLQAPSLASASPKLPNPLAQPAVPPSVSAPPKETKPKKKKPKINVTALLELEKDAQPATPSNEQQNVTGLGPPPSVVPEAPHPDTSSLSTFCIPGAEAAIELNSSTPGSGKIMSSEDANVEQNFHDPTPIPTDTGSAAPESNFVSSPVLPRPDSSLPGVVHQVIEQPHPLSHHSEPSAEGGIEDKEVEMNMNTDEPPKKDDAMMTENDAQEDAEMEMDNDARVPSPKPDDMDVDPPASENMAVNEDPSTAGDALEDYDEEGEISHALSASRRTTATSVEEGQILVQKTGGAADAEQTEEPATQPHTTDEWTKLVPGGRLAGSAVTHEPQKMQDLTDHNQQEAERGGVGDTQANKANTIAQTQHPDANADHLVARLEKAEQERRQEREHAPTRSASIDPTRAESARNFENTDTNKDVEMASTPTSRTPIPQIDKQSYRSSPVNTSTVVPPQNLSREASRASSAAAAQVNHAARQSSSARSTPKPAQVRNGTSAVPVPEPVSKAPKLYVPALAGFSSTMKVIAFHPTPPRGSVDFKIEMKENQLKSITSWNQRRDPNTPKNSIHKSTCLSLACYTAKDILRIKNEASAGELKGIEYQHFNKLTRDGFIDVGRYVREGINLITLHRSPRGLTEEFVLVLHAHSPTQAQMQELEKELENDVSWNTWLAEFARPFDISSSPFAGLL